MEQQDSELSELRSKLFELAAIKDDGEFLLAYAKSIEQLGIKMAMRQGETMSVRGGGRLWFPASKEAPWRIDYVQPSATGSTDEAGQIATRMQYLPMGRMVAAASRGKCSVLASHDDLNDAGLILVECPSGKLFLVDLVDELVTMLPH